MQEVNNFPGPYNYNKSSSFINLTTLKTLGNFDDYHNNLTPAWSFSLVDWPEPDFNEISVASVATTKDYEGFEPDINNRGYYHNKLQNDTSRRFPLLVLHFQHFFLFYLTVLLLVFYTGGTETQVKETLKLYKYRLRDELLRNIEIIDFCPLSEQEAHALKPPKYIFKKKLRTIAFFIIIVILIMLYPLYFI